MTRGPSHGLAARADDTDDVRWALQTALAQLKQGGQADAIVWIKRAADAADAAGVPHRGDELRAAARRMAEAMWDLGGGGAPAHATSDSLEIEIDVDDPASAPKRPPLQPPPGAVRSPSRPVRSPPPVPRTSQEPNAAARPSLRLKSPPRTGSSGMPSYGPPPLPASQFPPVAHQAPAPPGFSQPPVDRQSLAEAGPVRPPMASAPQLEVEELDPETLGFDLAELESRPPPSYRPEASRPPISSAERAGVGGVRPSFNDRLSSVDIEPLSVDAVIPEVGGVQFESSRPYAPSSLPPAPESVRRALTLIDDEEELEEDDEERVTYDLVQPSSFPPPQSVAPSYPPVPSSIPPASGQPASFAPASVSPASVAPASYRPEPRTVPPAKPSGRARRSSHAPNGAGNVASVLPAAAVPEDLGELTLEVSDLGPPDTALASEPPTALEPEASEEAAVDGILLEEVQGFEDLPAEVQRKLAAQARIEVLAEGEEVAFFGAAVVTSGSVDILPAFSDDAGAVAHQADVVFTQGTLSDSIELRVVAKVDETRVAVWAPDELEAALAECPWVEDELRFIADYFLAVCGAALGPLGERLDDSLRATVFRRLEVRALAPREMLLEAGESIHSLFVVGGGRLELNREGTSPVELPPGGFVFPDKMMTAQNAPCNVQAGEQGALVLFAPRAVAHELMMSVPPLLEVLAG